LLLCSRNPLTERGLRLRICNRGSFYFNKRTGQLHILFVITVGLFTAGLFLQGTETNKNMTALVDSAEIRFHIYGDERQPTRISQSNVWRWFILGIILPVKEIKTGKKRISIQPILFIVFDKPVKAGTLEVSSPDSKLPLYEVKEFRSRYAIIVFDGELTSGTLNIVAHPD